MQPDGSQLNPLPQPAILDVAAVGIGREPFADRKTCRRRCGGRRAGRRRRARRRCGRRSATSTSGTGVRAAQMTPSEHQAARRSSAAASSIVPSPGGPAVASSSGPVPNEVDAAEGAGQARHPQRDRVHPFDAVTHLPPAFGVEAERHGDARRGFPSASPRRTPPAWPEDWPERHRAPGDGSDRPHRAWWRSRRAAKQASGRRSR